MMWFTVGPHAIGIEAESVSGTVLRDKDAQGLF